MVAADLLTVVATPPPAMEETLLPTVAPATATLATTEATTAPTMITADATVNRM